MTTTKAARCCSTPRRANRWPSLLALGEALFGRLDWWPPAAADAGSSIIGALAGGRRDIAGRPAERPSRFADAGITLLRTDRGQAPEIWCRCDGGPHGYLSIAAHAHADALSVEVRYGGVDILADPGTYCYHGEPEWRSYFRSTIAHNTVELGGQSQSSEGGPFLWLRHASAREIDVRDDGEVASWTAEHDGYAVARPAGPASPHGPAGPGLAQHRHRRRDRAAATTSALPSISAPTCDAELDGTSAILSWPGAAAPGAARLELPGGLRWSLHRGETDPILGWYSCGLGRRVPTFTLLGRGRSAGDMVLATRLAFLGLDITQPVNIKPYYGYSPMPEGAGRVEDTRGGQ